METFSSNILLNHHNHNFVKTIAAKILLSTRTASTTAPPGKSPNRGPQG
jgi:hypothetical protein